MNNFGLKLLACVLILTSVACSNSKKYKVALNRVGLVTSETKVEEIDEIFKNDSVVKHLSEGLLGFQGAYQQEDDKYLIYSKKGKHLLTLTPKESLDSLSTIRFIDIYDPLYVTEKGIGLNSTFEEINLQTTIDKVEASFTKATLYLSEFNATMTLDKSDLGIKTMSTAEIQIGQIPNLVKPKSFVVWFD
ncbi:hypothetical protein [Flavicella sediminum]|uniref:hypothetical protein n=1 Tax=Flavicella sediminum TaxID=2585141 RepID=UPI001124AFBB|nr:hypothetical protein [Flavicella sediminum]